MYFAFTLDERPMSMRRAALSFLGLLMFPLLAYPQAPAMPYPAEVQQGPDLEQLGFDLQRLRQLANVYQRSELAQSVRDAAHSYEGQLADVEVTVERVTGCEVFLRIRNAGRTQIVIEHLETPPYGHLRTVYYPGGIGTQRANLLSRPFALRIGTEIELEIAKRLRQGQRLTIRGVIGTIVVDIEGFIEPRAIVIVRDWHVVTTELLQRGTS